MTQHYDIDSWVISSTRMSYHVWLGIHQRPDTCHSLFCLQTT